jgi:predicted DNA binding CopG/RHH family protein
MKAVQKFTDEYLERCREMSHEEIVRFLDDFRRLHGSGRARSKLISIKVPEDLLGAFKARARLCNVPYQTQMKKLMVDWLKDA